MREQETKTKYNEIVNRELENYKLNKYVEDIELIWNKFKTVLIKAAKESCGTIVQSHEIKRTNWWSQTIKAEVQKKKMLWKEYNRNQNKYTYKLYKEQRRIAKLAVAEGKKLSWEKLGDYMERNSRTNSKLFYKAIKGIRTPNERTVNFIKDAQGKLLTNTDEIVNRWKDYFAELLTSSKPQECAQIEQESEGNNENEQITEEELDKALARMKSGKASGSDGIVPEMLKGLETSGRKYLQWVVNRAWKTQSIPQEWSNAVILPIHKKGDKTKCDNYRGISLLNVTGKLYETILETRLRNEIDIQLQSEQSGFRSKHSTQDHLFTLQQIMEKALGKDNKIYMAFIDTKKAFDMLNREAIWEALKTKNVSVGLTTAIKNMYYQPNQNAR